MRFRIGDVCEIIDGPGISEQDRKFIGLEVTISGMPGSFRMDPDAYAVNCPADERCLGAYPQVLRLKRPPSWDKWIFDADLLGIGDRLDAGILHDLETPPKVEFANNALLELGNPFRFTP